MKNELSALNKKDTRLFLKKSNQLIRYFNGRIFLSSLKGDNEKKNRYKVRRDSLIRNKSINEFPKDFVEKGKKIAIYTALYGDYDVIKPVKTKNPLCDYYIFTDQPVPSDSGWQLKEFSFPEEIKNDPTLKNRYIKMHPHLLFPDYEYSIYLDAVFSIELDIYRLMGRMSEHFIGLYDYHQKADCAYDEAETIKRIKKAPVEIVNKQMEKYEEEGFPKHFGFVECALIIRKHHDIRCINVMDTWWREFMDGAKRDQLSFMYSIWKNGFSKKDIAYLGATFWDEPIVPSVGHKK